METINRFRFISVGSCLLITILAASAALLVSGPAAKGVVVGGLAGSLALWLMTRQMVRVTSIPKEAIPNNVFRASFVRILLYGVALALSVTFDADTMHGLFGALGGVLLSHVVLVFMGLVAAAQSRRPKPDLPPR